MRLESPQGNDRDLLFDNGQLPGKQRGLTFDDTPRVSVCVCDCRVLSLQTKTKVDAFPGVQMYEAPCQQLCRNGLLPWITWIVLPIYLLRGKPLQARTQTSMNSPLRPAVQF